MDLLRYPIGPFEPVRQSTNEQRKVWIDDIAAIPQTVRLAVQNLTPEQLHTPYRPGGWTIQQVVHHMADNDMNAYIRFKRALTEDNPTIGSYREKLWAELDDYRDTPVETSLALMKSLHSRFANLLRSLQPSHFERMFTSQALGVMTLDVALQRYAWHGRHHTAHITSLKNRMGW